MMISTIGHGALPLERFLALLRAHQVDLLVDVRSKPYSRWHPHYNKAALQGALKGVGCEYAHLPSLGGLHEGAGQGEAFDQGIAELLERARIHRTAVMCGCGKYEACHRETMIAACLRNLGHQVTHILQDGSALDCASGGAFSSVGNSKEAVKPSHRQLSLFPTMGENT